MHTHQCWCPEPSYPAAEQPTTASVHKAHTAQSDAWCTLLHVATAAAVVVTPADELWCVNAFDEVCVVWAWCMVLQQLFLLTAG